AGGARGWPATRGRAQPRLPSAPRAGGPRLRAAGDLRAGARTPLPGLSGRPSARRARPSRGRPRGGDGARGRACRAYGGRAAGVPLSALFAADNFPPLCQRVAAGLHQLHALPIDIGRERRASENAARVAASASEFAALLPAERPRIAALGRTLRARLSAMPLSPSRLGLIHGDFHGDNVVVDGTGLGLVDPESCAT